MRSLRLYQPQTLAAAAECLVDFLDPETKGVLRDLTEDEAMDWTHMGLGLAIRNAWLHGPSGAPLRAEANPYPDDPGLPRVSDDEISAAIIQRTWRILKQQC